MARHVDDVPAALVAHVRQQAEHQLHGGEVVEVDRALVVVEAVVAERDGAPDRASRVVDEHVDAGVVGQQRLDELVDRVEVAQVARRDVGGAAGGLDLGLDLVELVLRARDEDRDAARGGDLQRGGAADAATTRR